MGFSQNSQNLVTTMRAIWLQQVLAESLTEQMSVSRRRRHELLCCSRCKVGGLMKKVNRSKWAGG